MHEVPFMIVFGVIWIALFLIWLVSMIMLLIETHNKRHGKRGWL